MRKRNVFDAITGFFRLIYEKLVKIDDTPQKIASGFGIGVFAGVLPMAGPIAAVFLAVLFKVNRAAALLAALITNTWISFVIFLFSVKIGAFIFGVDGSAIQLQWAELLKDFHLSGLFKLSAMRIALPVITGYLVMALFSAGTAYVMILTVMKFIKNNGKS
ncbi:MAG: DUF2062 domain-containing protein [Candidatus Omnitrophica bacterium]|nr:DUF2062 domain-containing protein [Candidatus Omnitrophota bacterium]